MQPTNDSSESVQRLDLGLDSRPDFTNDALRTELEKEIHMANSRSMSLKPFEKLAYSAIAGFLAAVIFIPRPHH